MSLACLTITIIAHQKASYVILCLQPPDVWKETLASQ